MQLLDLFAGRAFRMSRDSKPALRTLPCCYFPPVR